MTVWTPCDQLRPLRCKPCLKWSWQGAAGNHEVTTNDQIGGFLVGFIHPKWSQKWGISVIQPRNTRPGKHRKSDWSHGHLVRWFTHWKRWFSIMLVYQRVWGFKQDISSRFVSVARAQNPGAMLLFTRPCTRRVIFFLGKTMIHRYLCGYGLVKPISWLFLRGNMMIDEPIRGNKIQQEFIETPRR